MAVEKIAVVLQMKTKRLPARTTKKKKNLVTKEIAIVRLVDYSPISLMSMEFAL